MNKGKRHLKKGDSLYTLRRKPDGSLYIMEVKIAGKFYHRDKFLMYKTEIGGVPPKFINYTWFLTKEAAEFKLEEMKNNLNIFKLSYSV